jgi:putative oxygen-independent coproporphyrinogen III oxidase
MILMPLSLYIHIPWCIKKCPYCDFNSHVARGDLPEAEYTAALITDLTQELPRIYDRKISSIFFGGGTPSLFSPSAIEKILLEINKLVPFNNNIEITLETNPGSLENKYIKDFKLAGVNRISLGAQSFQEDKLQALGRIHSIKDIASCLEQIISANLNSFNIDLMYGLPRQTIQDAIYDLKSAIAFNPPHLSWYNLTIEPNTVFYKSPPANLANNDDCYFIEQQGKELLSSHKLIQYEISAFAVENNQCQHNLNYWQFGDYLGIGAGAHSKITMPDKSVLRFSKFKNPKKYMDNINKNDTFEQVNKDNLTFEFMLNNLRLKSGFNKQLFESRTGLNSAVLDEKLAIAYKKELLYKKGEQIFISNLGNLFLNDLQEIFLPG